MTGVQGFPPSTTTPPTRPDRPAGSRRPSRGGLATLAVLGVIVTVVLGGYVTADALSEPSGSAVDVAGVVRVRPLSGWALAGRGEMAGGQFVHLTRGSGNLVVAAFGGPREDAGSLARGYADLLSGQLSRLSVSRPQAVRLASGAEGVRFGYVGVVAGTGTSIEGEVVVIVAASGDGVVFDAWAPAGALSFVRSDIETMIDLAEVAAG